MRNKMSVTGGAARVTQKALRILLCAMVLILLFRFYTWGVSQNPPGFFLDESATAYNAYLVSRTGAGEFGPRFPLLFRQFAVSNPTHMNPLAIYWMAIVFRFIHPSVAVARASAAFWMFAACLLLGVLAKRISGQRTVGIIVAGTALLTPWYALGLLLFATTWRRFIGVIKTWLAYGVTLVPLILFNRSHPGVVTKRLWEVTYINPGAPWKEVASQVAEFVRCYLQDQSLTPLLLTGDGHWPHHVEGSGGAIFFATFILAMAGLLLVIARRWREPWWRFVLFGLAVSIVPGAITDWPFHEVRLMGYAVFLLVLTVPALEWLLAPADPKHRVGDRTDTTHHGEPDRAVIVSHGPPRAVRLGIVAVLLAATVAQAVDFQIIFWRQGTERYFAFDVLYKAAYDAAVARPERPIYLENGQWGPAYMDAYWYATVEGRPISEFVRLAEGAKPPSGAIVLSSNSECQNCQAIQKSGCYLLYRAK